MRRKRTCAAGHVFYKSSDCATCPRCEATRAPAADFMAVLAAPARRALEREGLTTLAKLSRRSEAELGVLHGMGPNALGKLRALLRKKGLTFNQRRKSGSV